VVELFFIFFTPTFTLLNPRHAGFAGGEIQQGESSPVKGTDILLFPLILVLETRTGCFLASELSDSLIGV
jgi:hypothetical protein